MTGWWTVPEASDTAYCPMGDYISKCRQLVGRAVFHPRYTEEGEADDVGDNDCGDVGDHLLFIAGPPEYRARCKQSECQHVAHHLELTRKCATLATRSPATTEQG